MLTKNHKLHFTHFLSSIRFLPNMLVALLLGSLVLVQNALADTGATITIYEDGLEAVATVPNVVAIQLRVAGPGDYYAAERSESGSTDWYAPSGLLDGEYRYEVFVTTEATDTSEGDDEDNMQLYRENGRFKVQGGSVSPVSSPAPDAGVEPQASVLDQKPSVLARIAGAIVDVLIPRAEAADMTISDVTPSLIFDDTDTSGIDWHIWGEGASHFRLYDDQQSTLVSEILSSANNSNTMMVNSIGDITFASSAVFIDRSANRVGVGTITPARSIHVSSGDPALTLEDTHGVTWTLNNDAYSGYFDINWDNGVTSASPFHIEEDASDDTFYMTSTSDIGIGTSNPGSTLHVSRTSGAQVRVENTSTTAAERVPFRLVNKGKTRFVIEQTGVSTWTFDNDGNYFNISKIGTGLNEFRVDGSGHGYFRGNAYALNHVNTSSRKAKTGFKDLNRSEVLEKLMTLPVTQWQYKQDGSQHYGPVAEDFQATFGLGDGTHISTVDSAGVTMAALQGLYEMVQGKETEIKVLKAEKDAEIEILRSENEDLARRLAALETLVKRQSSTTFD